MSKIYVLTEGDYSDYHIVGVCSSKELAEKCKEAFGGYSEIEEYELDENVKQIKEGFKRYAVPMTKEGNIKPDGKVELVDDSYYSHCDKKEKDIHYVFQSWSIKNPDYERFGGLMMIPQSDYIIVFCWAKDEQHAIKIANEIRATLLAANEWGKNHE